MTVEETAQKIVQILTERAAECFTGQVDIHINFRDGGAVESKLISTESLAFARLKKQHGSDSVLRAVHREGPG